MELHWRILDSKRQKLLPSLAAWKREGLYLAGGTALALQLGHRTSVDFDFYSKDEFDLYSGLRGLVFFDEADQEKARLGVIAIQLTVDGDS